MALSRGNDTASYDAAGDLARCGPACPSFTQSDAFLSYGNERRQVGWSQGSSSATYAYDGEGNRVAQQTNVSGTVSTTRYVAGGLEEVTTAGSTTTLTKYESVKGVCSVVIVGSGPSESISYLATDGLGSVSEALDGNGNVTAQQLYGPYGTGRYSSGAMPTAKGYTGQYADAATGLDYYGARYYDAAIGQFTSADTAGDGLNRYAYVHDDPETATDPTGHRCSADGVCPGAGGGGGSGGSGGCGQCGKSPCAPNCSSGGTPPCIASCKSPCWPHCGSGGHGGSGKSGGNAQTNPSSTSPTPKCDSICQAQDAALKYSGKFGELVALFIAVGAALTALAATLISSIFGSEIGMFIVSFLIPFFLVLVADATFMMTDFANEFNYHAHDDAFWTTDGVGQYETSMLLELGSLNLAYAGLSKMIMGIPGAQEVIAPWAGGLFSGAAVGEFWFSSLVAQGFVEQDEALDASQPSGTATCDTRACKQQEAD